MRTSQLRYAEDANGCWLWTGATDRTGYGRIYMDGRQLAAHRVSWEAHRGPVPPGLEMDHLCRVRSCINPDHLEPVTRRENVLRSLSPGGLNATKTHCPQGHPYSPENTYSDPRGKRNCRACGRESARRRRRGHREATQ